MKRSILAAGALALLAASWFWSGRWGELPGLATARAQPAHVAPMAGSARIAEPGQLLSRMPLRPGAGVRGPGPARPAPGQPAPAQPPAAAADLPPPRVALLATVPGQGRTSLIFQPIDAATPAPAVATFAHLPRTTVSAAVVPHTSQVLVIAGTESRRDPAFGASLLMMGEQQEAKLVVDRVYHGTRPLLLDDGRAVVQRGTEGDEPSQADADAGRLRIDHLTVELVDLAADATRVLTRFDGYIAFVAGALRHEVFVYRVGPDGADIIGVDADSGKERTIARPIPPFARDFSVDAQDQALLFTDADPDHPGQWVAERLSVAPPPPAAPTVAPGSRLPVAARLERLQVADHPALAPTAWIGRGVAANQGKAGLQIVSAPRMQLGAAPGTKVPFTAGVDQVREFFLARQETWALAVHQEEGRLPQPVVIQTTTLNVQKIAVPPRALVDVAGVLEPAGTPRPQIRQILPRVAAPPVRIDPNRFKRYLPPSPGATGEEAP